MVKMSRSHQEDIYLYDENNKAEYYNSFNSKVSCLHSRKISSLVEASEDQRSWMNEHIKKCKLCQGEYSKALKFNSSLNKFIPMNILSGDIAVDIENAMDEFANTLRSSIVQRRKKKLVSVGEFFVESVKDLSISLFSVKTIKGLCLGSAVTFFLLFLMKFR